MRLLVTTVLLLALGAFAVPQTEHEDVPATLQRAHEALETAKRELQNLPIEFGGHGRDKAIGHVDDALASLRQAETLAKERHKYKQQDANEQLAPPIHRAAPMEHLADASVTGANAGAWSSKPRPCIGVERPWWVRLRPAPGAVNSLHPLISKKCDVVSRRMA